MTWHYVMYDDIINDKKNMKICISSFSINYIGLNWPWIMYISRYLLKGQIGNNNTSLLLKLTKCILEINEDMHFQFRYQLYRSKWSLTGQTRFSFYIYFVLRIRLIDIKVGANKINRLTRYVFILTNTLTGEHDCINLKITWK